MQDLYEEPFSAGKYKDDFLGFESGLSVDKKQLLSLSISTAPYVTMYREDIMKANGFPYEPAEFGKFIENPDNLIKIAKKLKENNKYIFSYPTDLTDVVGNSLGYFDDKLDYVRYGNLFEKSLDIMMQSSKNGWLLDENFWGEGGKTALKEDKLAMCFYGSYIMGTLERYVPEQKGKWRITTPPLGLASWASDSRAAINIQSDHKEEAWKLIEYIVTQKNKGGVDYTNTIPSYKPYINFEKNLNKKLQFYGDQNVYPIIKKLAENTKYFKLTPMDHKALEIYRNSVWTVMKQKSKPDEAVDKMKKILKRN
ncbi:extracellular solute-binding protein [Pseudobacteroides cellulosolvens]|uniref:Extracellular solute-binding protein family 1 n=1 Tax=Pseudobacteroides cellulosolvens ATCC 35603 = DSM 2933 TaxID=398512 RepID=A0A0L6JIZ6_9FIRM|nr:extracellular solute-binding protein family 1 [Pseudobacteroides cellulosolvens ATCC 35603 = DSM 2933]